MLISPGEKFVHLITEPLESNVVVCDLLGWQCHRAPEKKKHTRRLVLLGKLSNAASRQKLQSDSDQCPDAKKNEGTLCSFLVDRMTLFAPMIAWRSRLHMLRVSVMPALYTGTEETGAVTPPVDMANINAQLGAPPLAWISRARSSPAVIQHVLSWPFGRLVGFLGP